MTLTIDSLRAESRSDSTSVATPTPRLSWTTVGDIHPWTQARAELELDGTERVTIEGAESVFVAWPFAPLVPRSVHGVRVRVTGADGSASDWSAPLEVAAGFLGDGEWRAEFVGLPDPGDAAQPALLRSEFEVARPVARATLYATARGGYQVQVNGADVDDQILKPGWTPYRSRLIHETTDVTSLLVDGRNAIGMTLGGAWFTERFGMQVTSPPFYGAQPSAAAQLVLDYADGTSETIVSGAHWRASASPIMSSSIYDGEHYDARREQPGWSRAGFDDSGWVPVVVDRSEGPLPTARTSPGVRVIEERAVEREIASASGPPILDFGQNLVGRLRISVSGAAGDVVTLRHAEVLEHGELGIRPLRLAKATDTYTLRGDGVEVWEPAFTFHGFRYAQVLGASPIAAEAVTAVVIHSDMRRTGWFESSHALLNQLHENVVWGMRGNFLYLPTDCPQRDERLGWTGDIQVFAPTASFLYDADAFLSSWLTDLALEQQAAGGGIVPFIVPAVLHDAATPAAAWGDAATVVPSVLHERYGDTQVLAAQFESMRGWADCLLARAGDRLLWEHGFQFGDWLDPTAPPQNAFLAKTDADLIASAYLFRSVQLTAHAAGVLGRDEDARRYAELADRVRAAFEGEYLTETGRMMSDAQAAYAVAIVFGLSGSDAQRARMGDRLAELVRANGYRIGTGFVGTPVVADALTLTGHLDAAGRLLTQTENPSWLYPVTMGATTIWERWDSMLEDGSINPGEMTSFNHYALGAVADWLHRSVAGLAPAEPGYRVLRIAPQPIVELERAAATLDTPYGRARVAWRREGADLVVEAEVPANARAEVLLPGAATAIPVGSGSHAWRVAASLPAAPSPVERSTPLSDVIDDRAAYQAIANALGALDPALARRWRHDTRWISGVAVGDSLGLMSGAVSSALDGALAEVNAGR